MADCKKCFLGENDACYPHVAEDKECNFFRQKTNADYIRNMTDEELADWYFDKFFPYVPYCSILDECPEHDDCKICLLGWLKEESEGEDESR